MAYNTGYWEQKLYAAEQLAAQHEEQALMYAAQLSELTTRHKQLELHAGAVEDDLHGLLQKLVKQPDGSYVLSAQYEVEVIDAKRLVGLV